MTDEYIIEVPVSIFGKITKSQVILVGEFIVNATNLEVWNSVLSEVHLLLKNSGLQV